MDILSSFLQGQQAGQQQRTYRRGQGDLAKMESLAPRIVKGDMGAYAEAAAIDPVKANAYQGANDIQVRKLKGFVDYVNNARKSGNPAAVNAALQRGAPFITQLTGKPAPTEWTPDMDAGWAQLEAMVAMAGSDPSNVPTQFAALDMQAKAAGYQPGTQGYQDFFKRANGELARQSSAAIQYKEAEIDGRKVLVAVDPREIGAQVIGGGPAYGSYSGPQAGSTQPGALDFANDAQQFASLGIPVTSTVRDQANNQRVGGVPNSFHLTGEAMDIAPRNAQEKAQAQEYWRSRGYQVIDEGDHLHIEPPARGMTASQLRPGGLAGNPFASRRPEEEAAAVEAAKQGVQLQYLPTELGMRGQAAIEQTAGVEAAKARIEREQKEAGRVRDANNALDLLSEAERLLPQATGGRIAAIGDAVAGAAGIATDGAKANAALATIAGQLTAKMPRMEGPQSDRDVQMYKEMAGDLANANLPIEVRAASLRQIRRLQQKYADGPQKAVGPRARNPQTGQVIELRNGKWVPVQ